MPVLQNIRILSDGKRGHENQSLGLAEALRSRTGAQIETLAFAPKAGVFSRMRRACHRNTAPQLLIAAGHRTHLPLLIAGRRLAAPTVLIMRPSLPVRFFDLCLIPQHDLAETSESERIIPTVGALNRLPEDPPRKEPAGLIMLGGPCKHFDWNEKPVLDAIRTIVMSSPSLTWTLGDSRRTPEGLLGRIRELPLPLTITPHGETGPDWLPTSLRAADTVWVSPDSTSMVYEALTSRARVGLLPLTSNGTRLSRSIDQLVASGSVTPFRAWSPGAPLPAPAKPLHETSRCAEEVLARLFPAS
jgi:mitochondrial fission protein ELM1